MTAISVAGVPSTEGDSVAKTFDATITAIAQTLADNQGMPLLLDEAGRFGKGEDYTRLIYSIADGTDKSRCHKDLSIAHTSSWKTTVITTGEISLLDNSKPLEGLSARVVEINAEWTKSAEHSNKILEGLQKNYGHAILKLAEYIMTTTKMSDLVGIYDKWLEKIKSDNPNSSNVQYRLAQPNAVLMTTVEIASAALDLPFNSNAILKFFQASQRAKDSRPDEKKAYEFILQKVNQNMTKFLTIDPNVNYGDDFKCLYKKIDSFGYIKSMEKKPIDSETYSVREIVICEQKLQEWLKLGNFSTKMILKQWRDANILITKDKTRFIDRKRIHPSGTEVSCYRIREIKENPKPPRQEKQKLTPSEIEALCAQLDEIEALEAQKYITINRPKHMIFTQDSSANAEESEYTEIKNRNRIKMSVKNDDADNIEESTQ